VNWGRVQGFTYAVLLGFGAILAVLWGAVYYNISRDLITTVSTAASGFATYAVGLVAVHVAGHQLSGFFGRLYTVTRSWKLPGSHDVQVLIFVVLGIAVGYVLWQ
jgi:zinc transporter ZupT